MVELPTELWLRIIHFVPDEHLFRLASVDRLFLDQATDRRYRHFIIDDDRPQILLGKLAKHQDSSIAGRVRSLTIHPMAIRSACLRSGKGVKNRVRPAKNQYWPNDFRYRTAKYPIEEDVGLADKILDLLANLSNIDEFAVEWDQGVADELPFCLPLLNAIWPIFHNNLRVIKLDMILRHMAAMVSPLTGLDRVQEVSLHFTTTDDTRLASLGGTGYDPKDAFSQLSAFLNRLSPSLKAMTISSSGHLDFSSLYNNLTYFPRLISLSILLPCDPRHVVDPKGLGRFLRVHNRVERLNFTPKHCCCQSKQDPGATPGHISPEDWLSRVFENVIFSNLHSLELGLNVCAGGKRVMLAVPRVAGAAKNVKCLIITGCIIALEDLRLLLEPFSPAVGGTSPRTLVLEVRVLDVALLDLLADLLPGLEMLHLTYRWLNCFDCINAAEFTEQLRSRVYEQWKLSQLVLCCSRKYDDDQWPSRLAFAPSLPNLH
ncbi:hypothetical protein JR316_0012172 [Psilocybe cubensis]|uniref:Uncharacterized protein n=2 Tax=Psilocybe cubensis TaxID=181762 RepID=A0ACB8GI34_PSICU|nr:hypothetical protein JR316_0012172 [Psilocybe cubensis]KAH9475067.1 hypothetical protein JR316_0012172 [Psilocybe cubensis]